MAANESEKIILFPGIIDVTECIPIGRRAYVEAKRIIAGDPDTIRVHETILTLTSAHRAGELQPPITDNLAGVLADMAKFDHEVLKDNTRRYAANLAIHAALDHSETHA